MNQSAIVVILTAIIVLGCSIVYAHCDTMDGPVVKAAQKALDAGDVNFVLVWVQSKDDAEIKKAYEKTLEVRKLSLQAKELADMYFFETLVRIHRAGEGAPYTGIKPAGTEIEPGIKAADKAVETNSIDELQAMLSKNISDELNKKFAEVLETKNYKPDDVNAGRKFVRAYVEFIHYAEGVLVAAEAKHSVHEVSKESKGQELKHEH